MTIVYLLKHQTLLLKRYLAAQFPAIIRRKRFLSTRGLTKYISSQSEIDCSYLITTESGVFLVTPTVCKQLTSLPGYGVAITGQTVYLSVETEEMASFGFTRISKVVCTSLDKLLSGKLINAGASHFKTLYSMPLMSTNERIHQIRHTNQVSGFDGSFLLVTSTGENAIIVLSSSGQVLGRIWPFTDRFGMPIRNNDHNHINTVLEIDGRIFFVAYKARSDSSFIGYLWDGTLYGWEPEPRGFHDLEVTANGFVTSDTFGRTSGGRIVTECGYLSESFFAERNLAPRGIAFGHGETIIGHSHKGERVKRYEGTGGLIVFSGNGAPKFYEAPWSQTYDILSLDHTGSTTGLNADSLIKLFDRRFGAHVAYGRYVWET